MKRTRDIGFVPIRAVFLLLVMMLTTMTARAEVLELDDDYQYFYATDGTFVTGSTNGLLMIENGASITLSNVTINGGITCYGSATITLVGTNSVRGTGSHGAAILIGGAGTTLTIQGDGSLTAAGYYGKGAGIGLDNGHNSGGNIVIKGGTVTAEGYNGFGTGNFTNGSSTIGEITIYNTVTKVDASSFSNAVTYIYDETDVTAKAAEYFSIVENGNRRIITPLLVVTLSGSNNYTAQDGDRLTGSTEGTVTIADGASITLSNTTINGGIVCAGTATITLIGTNSVTGNYLKAGIQVGGSGTTLTIKGNGSLTATGGLRSAGIGLSSEYNATGGDVVIEGGNITAIGGALDAIQSQKRGAGIGTCVLFNNGSNYIFGSIIIKGGTVTATGESGIGIGFTYPNPSYTIGSVMIYDTIDKVDASIICNDVTYMHGSTNVTANKTIYFAIIEDGNHMLIEPKDQTDYTITIASGTEHGTISGPATAKYADWVTLTVAPESHYCLASLTVKDNNNNDIALNGTSFYMPRGNVTVSAEFQYGIWLSGSNNYTVQDGDELFGSTNGTVTIASGAGITLNGVTVNNGIVCAGDAEITLVGTNSVGGTNNSYNNNFKAGIQVGGPGTMLTIKGDGSLTALGGMGAAGIGLSRAYGVDATGGNIVIEGGNITAKSYSWGAGIGTCESYNASASLGNITIKGGTVTATGGSANDGIGKGHGMSGGTNTVGQITIYDSIDKIEASKIGDFGSVVYMHDDTNVTDNKCDYFLFMSNDNNIIISSVPDVFYISDDNPYKLTSDSNIPCATYTKTLGKEREGKHQAWMVPFDYTITESDLTKFSFYKINMIANSPLPSVEATDEMWVFLTRLSTGDVLHANMPYVYKPLQAVTDYEFTSAPATLKTKDTDVLAKTETLEDIYSFYATYENTTATADAPFYYVNIDGNLSLGTSVTVGPFRWIIRKDSKFSSTTYAREMHFWDGEEDATSINVNDNDNVNTNDDAWYDLSGRRINSQFSILNSQLPKGLYIHNGRKEAVR